MYQLNAEEKANNISILVSISAPCVEQLNKLFSIPAEMKKFYPHASDISLDPISFSLSLNFELDLDADNAKAIENISLLKRNLFSIPFYHAISLQESDCQNSQKPFMFAYRPDEYVFIKPYSDRIVAIFQLRFKGNDDTIIAKVFIQVSVAAITLCVRNLLMPESCPICKTRLKSFSPNQLPLSWITWILCLCKNVPLNKMVTFR